MRRRLAWATASCTWLVLWLVGCANQDQTSGSGSPGGSRATGGVVASMGGKASAGGARPVGAGGNSADGGATVGGTRSNGGTGPSGGVRALGGTTGNGGTRPTGGAISSGGTPSTGGFPAGGTVVTGGAATRGGTAQGQGGAATGGLANGGALVGGSASAAGGSTASGGNAGGNANCLGAAFLSSLGKSSLLVGAAMTDATANSAPFDGRYLYLAGGYFDGSEPCASCATGCTAQGTSCANTVGCAWWGCWQYDQDPPGQYVVNFATTAGNATYSGQPHPQIPMFTYYQVLQASGVAEGRPQVAAMNDAAFLHRYFGDFRLMLQRIGSGRALVHLEPDFWGYVEQTGTAPHLLAAPVATANPTDCSALENSIAGVARCLISMVRKYAPNAKVGLHASGWATNIDVLSNTDPAFDVVAEGTKLGNYLISLGAGEGDCVVADMSDRDAGFYELQGRESWWDATNATLPNFHQAFAWAKAVSDTVGKPIVWWQIPVGNMAQNDTTNHYRDNRVDYLFAHLDEVIAAGGVGLFFGAGDGQQTTPDTDGGNLVAKIQAYAAAPPSPCP
jgi:hypothetical protein